MSKQKAEACNLSQSVSCH